MTRRRAYAMRIQSIEEHRVIWGMLAKGRGNVMAETNFQYAWSDADAYEAFMGRWSELLAPIFIDFTGIAPDARVLDVACGTGVLSKALAEAGASVVGVDASAGYLAGARSHRSHPNVNYEECDIRRMQFADNAFDAAVSQPVLDALVRDFPSDTEDELAWRLIARIGRDASALLLPVFERTKGEKGYLSMQVERTTGVRRACLRRQWPVRRSGFRRLRVGRCASLRSSAARAGRRCSW